LAKKTTISGKLTRDHKSFPEGFTFSIDGPMSIISGVNGSGKSQLLEQISEQKTIVGNSFVTSAEVLLNAAVLKPEEVGFRSFKNNIDVGKFGPANPSIYDIAKSEISRLYERHQLNENSTALSPNVLANLAEIKNAKEALISKYGEEKFRSGTISREEIISCSALQSFSWRQNDIFVNSVSALFHKFAFKKLQLERKFSRSSEVVDFSTLGKPPWEEFNELFELLSFDYRFDSDYEIIQQGFALSENPELKTQGSPDLVRQLIDLSDGEKAIFSLAVGTMQSRDAALKILLLDEFDATLNPTLIEALFVILNRYFIEKGKLVVMATHSPITISMAPESARFYEMVPERISPERIHLADRASYAELRRSFETFLKNTALLSAVHSDKFDPSILAEKEKIVVLVEGPTDEKYLNHAASILGLTDALSRFRFKQVGYESDKGSKLSGRAGLVIAEQFLEAQKSLSHGRFVILHDPEETKIAPRDISKTVFIRKMHKPDSKLNSGIEMLLSNSCIATARLNNASWFRYEVDGEVERNLRVKEEGKAALCNWVCSTDNKEYVAEFEKLFKLLISIEL